MFPKDWTPRSLIVAGSVFVGLALLFIGLGAVAGDPFAWFVGLTSVVPAVAMLIDGIRRRSKHARITSARERS
jgi:peptidoglycan/LPS O-acetylase OafA/YrhL